MENEGIQEMTKSTNYNESHMINRVITSSVLFISSASLQIKAFGLSVHSGRRDHIPTTHHGRTDTMRAAML